MVVLGLSFTRENSKKLEDAVAKPIPVGQHSAPNGEISNKINCHLVKQGKLCFV